MSARVLFSLLALLLLGLSGNACGHGLSAEASKTLVVTGDERFRVKLLLEPAAIEFVRPNILEVSILDMEEAAHFYGSVQTSLFRVDEDRQAVELSSASFDKGWFTTEGRFRQAGRHELVVAFSNTQLARSFSLFFEVEDERSTPLRIAIGSGLTFAALLLGLGILVRKQRRTNAAG